MRINFQKDFAEFVTLLEKHQVEYLVVGGYAIDGVTFDKCYKNKVVDGFDGFTYKFISYADLIKNKKSSGRNKDLADLDNL